MSETFLDGKVTLLRGDCLELLPTLEADSIDSCVTDPPYHLTPINSLGGSQYAKQKNGAPKTSRGFMGKQWDGGDIAFRPELWAEVLRVLKPGAHLLAFSGTRTYHRMACAIEDAGFEIRDQIGWCYGSGFPKSHDIAKAIDKMDGIEFEALPASGVGFMGPDGPGGYNVTKHQLKRIGESSERATEWRGWGTALKPAWEPIVLARKPLSESSIAANVLKHGTGAINIDGCRIGVDERHNPSAGNKNLANRHTVTPISKHGETDGRICVGRWPANLIHDNSEQVVRGFPETGNNLRASKNPNGTMGYCGGEGGIDGTGHDDRGSAARFFYTAKADTDDRLGSKHPTVKPLDLIQYLARLITPRGGRILDPFAGTGTTGEAAWREGLSSILIEREEEYQADIVKRMSLCLAGPDERRANSVKQVGVEDTPLFGGIG